MHRINGNGIDKTKSLYNGNDNNGIGNERNEWRRPPDPEGFIRRHDAKMKERAIDHDADKICREVGNKQYKAFYCKALRKLGPARVFNLWDLAKEQSNTPAKLFTYLLKKDGV